MEFEQDWGCSRHGNLCSKYSRFFENALLFLSKTWWKIQRCTDSSGNKWTAVWKVSRNRIINFRWCCWWWRRIKIFFSFFVPSIANDIFCSNIIYRLILAPEIPKKWQKKLNWVVEKTLYGGWNKWIECNGFTRKTPRFRSSFFLALVCSVINV